MDIELKEIIGKLGRLSPEQALHEIEQASCQVQAQSEWLYLSACFLTDLQQYEKAKHNFFLLLDKEPDHELARVQLALLHFNLGEFKQILYLLSPYLVWQTSQTCIAHIAHALLSCIKNDLVKAERELGCAKLMEGADLLEPIISKLHSIFSQFTGETLSNSEVGSEPTKNEARFQLLNNIYGRKY